MNISQSSLKSPKHGETRCCLLHIMLDPRTFTQSGFSMGGLLNRGSCEYIREILQVSQSFSVKLQHFLCRCLRLREKERPSTVDLLSSEYLQSALEESLGPQVSLHELLNISSVQISLSSATEQLDRTCRQMLVVFPECKNLISSQAGKMQLQKLRELKETDE